MQFRLLTGEVIPLADREFLWIALHRYLLLFYALIVAFVFVANANSARDAVPLELKVMGYGATVLFGVLVLFTSVAVIGRITLRRTGRQIIPFPAILAITVGCSVLFGEALSPWLYGDPPASVSQILMKIGFYLVIIEVAAAVVMYVLLPRILSHVRGGAYRSILDLIHKPEVAMPPAPLRLADHDLTADSLIRIGVDGDVIRVVTSDGTRVTQGPLTQLIDLLPAELGILVHRSDWVARAAVVGTTRIGRGRALRLRNGDVVRVASSRDAVVAEWLRQNGLI